MPLPKHTRRYSPLYIEETERYDGGNTLPRSRYRSFRGLCQSRLYSLVFVVAMASAAVVLVMRGLFHLSIPNLLRTTFGGTNANVSLVEAVCLVRNQTSTESAIYNKISLESVHCNKQAKPINQTFDGIASHGFLWDDQDAITTQWRPQGVTTYHYSDTRWVLVSWYGRKDEDYADRGGRISFVNVGTNYSSYFYAHVLLVDYNFCTLPNIHVGGIEQQNGTLYVADSRKGMQRILQFDLVNDLYEVNEDKINSSVMFGHRYLLRQSASFPSPTKPSFMSYDIDNEMFVIGTYARCGPKVGIHLDSEKCLTQSNNQLVWVKPSMIDSNESSTDYLPSCWHYFSEMQGAVSARVGNDTIVWVSSSYGPIAESHLHVVNMSAFASKCIESQSTNSFSVLDQVTIYRYPPGLEDLHIEQLNDDRFMWMNTEFGTRMVFAASLLDISLH